MNARPMPKAPIHLGTPHATVSHRSSWAMRERLTPARLLLLSFVGLISAGTVGLKVLPGLYVGETLSWLDALFTATSAVCVTGLIVVDTATYFTIWGQAFLLLLIQLGGLGILTFATLALLAVGRRLSLHHEALSADMTDVLPDVNPRHMVKHLVVFTFALEGLGALVLFILWLGRFSPAEALWHSLFHAISAFCNAGFSTFSDSLTGFGGSASTLLVVMGLIVLGGLGFLTLKEIRSLRPPRWRVRSFRSLSLHSRLVLTMTGGLLVGGCILFLVLEGGNVLRGFSPLDRVANGMFMSVTARTAGFNTVDYGATADATSFLTILLMSVGGSPGSAAGGLKTTTVAVIGLPAWARLRGDGGANAWGRSVPDETVHRSVGLFVLMFGTTTLGVLLLTLLEPAEMASAAVRRGFLAQMFEVVSAFNTVGLSMGVTSHLTGMAKAVTILLMFVGRVGPLVVATALAREKSNGRNGFRFSHEDVMIG